MKAMIAFWNILAKDIRAYYLKPPNISWGIIFPLAWTLMFLIRSGLGMDNITELLPGLMGISILYGTTSLLAVTITFEKKGRSFERLLLAPISLELLMLAKTTGAIIFGVVNALIPLIIAYFVMDISNIRLLTLIPALFLIAISSTFLGLFIAVSAKEVFEAQTFSNFFRFPMLFLCGLFFPIEHLPLWLQPISYILPLTYGVDLIKTSINQTAVMPEILSFSMLAVFCLLLFSISIKNIRRKWIR